MNDNLVTTKGAAEILGVSTSTIYRMEKLKILKPSKTIGGQRRFSVIDLEKYKEVSKNNNAPQNPYIEKLVKEESAEVEKKVDSRNKLNDLNGTEWLPATKSFMFQRGLGSKHPHAQIERQHPAPYSYQDIEQLILFFTKKGQKVLDPFGGVGSTAKACELLGRTCTSIELSPKWSELAVQRLEKEVGEGTSNNHIFINGDSRNELKKIEDNYFDFMVTSPPYWSILNKKADHKVKKERVAFNLDTNYSNCEESDMGNIKNYEDFLQELVDGIFLEAARVIKQKGYMCIVVSDFRNKSEYISFHSDLIQRMNRRTIHGGGRLSLQGTKILIQNHKSLLPYGYPFAYVENIHHQYILIFRKEK